MKTSSNDVLHCWTNWSDSWVWTEHDRTLTIYIFLIVWSKYGCRTNSSLSVLLQVFNYFTLVRVVRLPCRPSPSEAAFWRGRLSARPSVGENVFFLNRIILNVLYLNSNSNWSQWQLIQALAIRYVYNYFIFHVCSSWAVKK